MSSTTSDMDIRSYIVALEAQLDDLPEVDRRELLEDLEQHITEVAAEGEGTLSERLGTPASYAAELRASAGLPPRAQHALALVDRVRQIPAALRRRTQIRGFRDLLRRLRPAWWALCGVLAAYGVVALLNDPGYGPEFMGPIGIAWLAMWIAAFVAFGTIAKPSRVSAAVVIAFTLFIFVAGQQRASVPLTAEYSQEESIPWLHHEDETPISNICAYDSKLRPQGKVLLYDQNGRPIDNLAAPENAEGAIPGAELERSLGNAYPRRQKVIDPSTGEFVNFECPAFEDTKARLSEAPEPAPEARSPVDGEPPAAP